MNARKARRLELRQAMNRILQIKSASGIVPVFAVYGNPLRLAELIVNTNPRRRKRGLRILNAHLKRTVGSFDRG